MLTAFRYAFPYLLITLTCLCGCTGNTGQAGNGDKASAGMVHGSDHAGNSETKKVTIDNFTFSPAKLTISAGTEVTWLNQDDVPHTVTSTAKPKAFDSGTLDTDQKFSHVFKEPGTYDYFCAV